MIKSLSKDKGIVRILIILLLSLIGVTSYLYIAAAEDNKEKINVSVVVYGNSTERWIAFEQGVSQAAEDLGAVVDFVTMTSDSDWEEQSWLLKREKENGAAGIITAVVDSFQMGQEITGLVQEIPVVLVENSLEENETLSYISADDFGMGAALAEQILAEEKVTEVWQLGPKKQRSSQIERLAGLKEAITDTGRQFFELEEPTDEAILDLLTKGQGCVVIALEDTMLECLADFESDEIQTPIYGIGSTPKVVYALDRGKIAGIVFQNEFNMGYEAMRCLVEQINHKVPGNQAEIDYHSATQKTLHLPENERLLYPIAQ